MPEKLKFGAVFLASLVASLSTVFWAVYQSHNKDNAGRGGAVGTCIALVFMFLNKSYGARFYDSVSRRIPDLETWINNLRHPPDPASPSPPPSPPTLESLAAKVEALAAAIVIDGKEQKWQSVCLATATGIGTLFWGFGDMIAGFFIDPPLIPPCR